MAEAEDQLRKKRLLGSIIVMVIGSTAIGLGGVAVAPIGGISLIMGARMYRATKEPPRPLWQVFLVALGVLATVLLVEGFAIVAWRYARR